MKRLSESFGVFCFFFSLPVRSSVPLCVGVIAPQCRVRGYEHFSHEGIVRFLGLCTKFLGLCFQWAMAQIFPYLDK